jgi:LPS O-antigen subunit length determinant protein (WzzB/FepE family)
MYRLILIAIFATATAVWAQDPAVEDETVSEPETETVEGLTAEELDDLDLDRQQDHTEEDEDVFTPTDVVSFQQSVNFPVDI